jgi:hypothetical protein
MLVTRDTRDIPEDSFHHGHRRDKLRSSKLELSVAERSDSSRGNAAGTLLGTGGDRFFPVRHSFYIWTLSAAQTDPQKLDKKSSVFWDVTPCSRVESQPNKLSKSRE